MMNDSAFCMKKATIEEFNFLKKLFQTKRIISIVNDNRYTNKPDIKDFAISSMSMDSDNSLTIIVKQVNHFNWKDAQAKMGKNLLKILRK